MLLTLEAKDYGDVLDCAIRDRPGSWPTPEAVQDEENLCGRNLPRPSWAHVGTVCVGDNSSL